MRAQQAGTRCPARRPTRCDRRCRPGPGRGSDAWRRPVAGPCDGYRSIAIRPQNGWRLKRKRPDPWDLASACSMVPKVGYEVPVSLANSGCITHCYTTEKSRSPGRDVVHAGCACSSLCASLRCTDSELGLAVEGQSLVIPIPTRCGHRWLAGAGRADPLPWDPWWSYLKSRGPTAVPDSSVDNTVGSGESQYMRLDVVVGTLTTGLLTC